MRANFPSGGGFTAQRLFLTRCPVSGGPLYSYRLSDQEFQELQALVAQRAQRTGIEHFDNHEAAVFCLYGAEWWRRNFSGGAWSWENILRPVGAELSGSVAVLYPIVRKGLLYWKRKVRTTGSRNIFLVTLAIEGGLPLKLIQRDGLWLRRYFRRLMEQHRDFGQVCGAAELARDLAPLLPVSLRHEEIYELAGALVGKVWELQEQLGETRTPIEDLHARRPGWESELPLQVADDVAQELLLGLIRDAAEVRAGRAVRLRVSTWLERRAGGYGLYRGVDLPPRVELGQLRALMGQARSEEDLLARLHLSAWDACEAIWPVGVLSRVFERDSYVVEPARTDLEVRLPVEGQVRLKLHVGTSEHGTLQVPGGEALGDLPWVFEAPEGGQPARLLGEGSVSTRRAQVLVALPAGWTLADEEGGSGEEVGALGGLSGLGGTPERMLWRVQGAWTASCNGMSCRVLTGVAEAVAYQYALRGKTLDVAGLAEPVYLGVPQVWRCAEEGAWQRVPERELTLSSEQGEVRIQHRAAGEVKYQVKARVLPEQAQVEVHPEREGAGRIELSHLRTFRVQCEPAAGVTCKREYLKGQHRHVLRFEATGVPLAEVAVLIDWGTGQPMRLRLPYPAAGAWFVDREGKVLADGAAVALSSLPAIKLNALCPGRVVMVQAAMEVHDAAELRADLRARRMMLGPLASEGPRVVQSLVPLVEALQPYFAATLEHYTPVVLTAEVNGKPMRSLRVLRHAGKVKRISDEPRRFQVQRNDGTRIATPCKVIALPLWDPSRMSELPLDGESYAPPAERENGPWLVMALNGEYYGPCLDGVPAAKGYSVPVGVGPLTLKAVSCQEESRQRRVLFTQWYRELVENPGHREWSQVLASLKQLHHAPAQWFDQVRSLAENPDAAALAGLYVEAGDFAAFFKGMESLPFSFASMPVASWVRAGNARAALLGALPLEGDILALAKASCVQNLAELAPRWLRGLRATAELVQHVVLGGAAPQPAEKLWAGETSRMLAARQELFRGHAHDHWPQWSEWQAKFTSVQQEVSVELRGILEGAKGAAEIGYRMPVMIAPAIAAVASAWGLPLSRRTIFYINVLRHFDPAWFETAHEVMLKLCIAILYKTQPARLGLARCA